MPELEKDIAGAGKLCLKIHKIDRKIHSKRLKIYVYYNIFASLLVFTVYSPYLCSIISF